MASDDTNATLHVGIDASDAKKGAKEAIQAITEYKNAADSAKQAAKLDPSGLNAQVKHYDALVMSAKAYGTAIDRIKEEQRQMVAADPTSTTSREYQRLEKQVVRYGHAQDRVNVQAATQSRTVATAIAAQGLSYDKLDPHIARIGREGLTAAAELRKMQSVDLSRPTAESARAARSTEALGNAAGRASGLIRRMVTSGLLVRGISSAFGVARSQVGGLLKDLDDSRATWATFNSNMKTMGASSSEITKLKKDFQDYGAQTIYSSSDMAAAYTQLRAVGIKSADDLVKGFAGLASGAEDPIQAMKSITQQATQMAAKPKVQWEDFKIMLEQAPGSMAQVAKAMGMSTTELVQSVHNGTVSTQDFFDAMTKAGNSASMQKSATEFKNIGQAIDGTKEALENKLQPTYDRLAKLAIVWIGQISDKLNGIDYDALINKLQGPAMAAFQVFKNLGLIVWQFLQAIGTTENMEAFSNAMVSISNAFATFTQQGSAGAAIIQVIGQVIGMLVRVVSGAVAVIGSFLASLSPGALNTVAVGVSGLVLAFLGLRVVSGLAGMFSTLKGGLDLFRGSAVATAGAAAQTTGVMASFTQAVGAGLRSFLQFAGVSLLAVSLAYSLRILAGSVAQLGAMSWGQIVKGLVGLAGAMAVLAGGAAILAFIGQSMTIGVVAISAFAAAMALLVNAISNAAVNFAVAARILQPMVGSVIHTFQRLADHNFYVSIFNGISHAIQGFRDGLTQNWQKIADAGADIILTFTQAIGYAIGRVNFVTLGAAFATGLFGGIKASWHGIITKGVGGLIKSTGSSASGGFGTRMAFAEDSAPTYKATPMMSFMSLRSFRTATPQVSGLSPIAAGASYSPRASKAQTVNNSTNNQNVHITINSKNQPPKLVAEAVVKAMHEKFA